MTNEDSKAFVKAAYAVKDKSGIEDFYQRWAEQYDEQMQAGLGYISPAAITDKLALYLASGDVIDIGCGTGLVANELVRCGFSVIDGIDLSDAMLQVAQLGGNYRELIQADLTEQLLIEDNKYAAAICAGTFTHGHVGPQALDEIIRIVNRGGLLAFTVHFELWEAGGFNAKLTKLVSAGSLEKIEVVPGPYYADGEDEGWFCVYRKPG